jgi:hypothetical protein
LRAALVALDAEGNPAPEEVGALAGGVCSTERTFGELHDYSSK